MTQKTASDTPQTKNSTKRPNETGSVRVEGFVRIFDPKTKQVFVEKRA
jgi:hypothetical protein